MATSPRPAPIAAARPPSKVTRGPSTMMDRPMGAGGNSPVRPMPSLLSQEHAALLNQKQLRKQQAQPMMPQVQPGQQTPPPPMRTGGPGAPPPPMQQQPMRTGGPGAPPPPMQQQPSSAEMQQMMQQMMQQPMQGGPSRMPPGMAQAYGAQQDLQRQTEMAQQQTLGQIPAYGQIQAIQGQLQGRQPNPQQLQQLEMLDQQVRGDPRMQAFQQQQSQQHQQFQQQYGGQLRAYEQFQQQQQPKPPDMGRGQQPMPSPNMPMDMMYRPGSMPEASPQQRQQREMEMGRLQQMAMQQMQPFNQQPMQQAQYGGPLGAGAMQQPMQGGMSPVTTNYLGQQAPQPAMQQQPFNMAQNQQAPTAQSPLQSGGIGQLFGQQNQQSAPPQFAQQAPAVAGQAPAAGGQPPATSMNKPAGGGGIM